MRKNSSYEWSCRIMGALYAVAGTLHFIRSESYLKIMPPYFLKPLLLVFLSGIAEIFFGIALIVPRTRRLGAWGILALLVAVFPANIYMYQQGGAQFDLPDWIVFWRLPLQAVLLGWAYIYTRP